MFSAVCASTHSLFGRMPFNITYCTSVGVWKITYYPMQSMSSKVSTKPNQTNWLLCIRAIFFTSELLYSYHIFFRSDYINPLGTLPKYLDFMRLRSLFLIFLWDGAQFDWIFKENWKNSKLKMKIMNLNIMKLENMWYSKAWEIIYEKNVTRIKKIHLLSAFDNISVEFLWNMTKNDFIPFRKKFFSSFHA